MRYIAPFHKIKAAWMLTSVDGRDHVRLSYDRFIDIVRLLRVPVPVDPDWYLATYPDVAVAVTRGNVFTSAQHHYAAAGYFEGRMPFQAAAHQSGTPMPFAAIKKLVRVTPMRNGLWIESPYDEFLAVIRMVLSSVPVDESWYLATYADAANTTEAGTITSATEHFMQHGYAIGYWPFDIPVDEEWYLATNGDVREQVVKGRLLDAKQHFRNWGYLEGRLPDRNVPII